jgi:hypothetical protein
MLSCRVAHFSMTRSPVGECSKDWIYRPRHLKELDDNKMAVGPVALVQDNHLGAC